MKAVGFSFTPSINIVITAINRLFPSYILARPSSALQPWSVHPFLIPSNELATTATPHHPQPTISWSRDGPSRGANTTYSPALGGAGRLNQYWPNYCIRGAFLTHKPSLSLSLSLSLSIYSRLSRQLHKSLQTGLGYVKVKELGHYPFREIITGDVAKQC